MNKGFNETLTLYKLMILYMLNRVSSPLSASQISDFMLMKGYAPYFRMQEALADLQEAELISAETTYKRTIYRITEKGKETLHFFQSRIGREIKSDIDDYLQEKQYELRDEISVRSDYKLNADHEYEVTCQIFENDACTVDLKLIVPTKKEALSIAENWEKKHQSVYSLLLSELL
jgi:DNA-binding PadR family transcriptional regulator